MSRFGWVVVVVLFTGGACSTSYLSRAKSTIKSAGGTTITQDGNVAAPAQVNTTTTRTVAPIPPGSKITIETPTAISPDVNIPTPVLTSTTTTETLQAPSSYAPPAPPTPSQNADAKLRVGMWFGLIVGIAAALFGLIRGWNFVMYGGIAVGGACAVGLFMQQYPWLLAIIGAGVALAVAGPYLWHTQIKPKLTTNPQS